MSVVGGYLHSHQVVHSLVQVTLLESNSHGNASASGEGIALHEARLGSKIALLMDNVGGLRSGGSRCRGDEAGQEKVVELHCETLQDERTKSMKKSGVMGSLSCQIGVGSADYIRRRSPHAGPCQSDDLRRLLPWWTMV